MAPEQIRGKARPASDQYALGVVIYEWLSGACPFRGLNLHRNCHATHLGSSTSIARDAPNITAEVEQVILRALAKEPKQRFATIQEFAMPWSRCIS